MKDHRFIELVNLYIDRQITAAETVELEAEIQSNPRRRTVYRQYCQMNHATKLVFDSFQAKDQPATAPFPHSTIARFESQRRGRGYRWAYYAGGLAAAACLALVVARLNRPRAGGEPDTLASGDPHPAAQVATTQPQAQPVSIPVREAVAPRAGPVSLRNAADETDYAVLIATLRQDELRNAPIQSGRLPSLFDDGTFESQQVFPVGNPRNFRSRQTPAQQAAFTAFQFQR